MRRLLVAFLLIASTAPSVACDDRGTPSGCAGGCVDLGSDPLLRQHNDASLPDIATHIFA